MRPPPSLRSRLLAHTPYLIDHTYAAALFQTGWFVESLMTQTLIIHVIRTRQIPFIQARASRTSFDDYRCHYGHCRMAAVFAASYRNAPVSFLCPSFWPITGVTLYACYVVLTQLVKMWLIRRKWL